MSTKKLTYCLLFILPCLFLFGSGKTLEGTEYKKKSIAVNPCPVQTDHNKRIINDFITSPDWKQGREETNTDHLTASQITLLQSSKYSSTCEALNDKFQESITAKWPDGDLKNDLTYYKVGDYFIVVETPHQSDAPDEFVTGDTFLTIFDEDLNVVKGYFF